MDQDKNVVEQNEKSAVPKNVSGRKKKKLEKIEAHLAKKREKERKTVVVDNFGKKIVMTFVCLAFAAILVPFGVINLAKKDGIETVTVNSAIKYVEKVFDDATPKTIVYKYNIGANEYREEFTFKGKTLVGRVSYNGSTSTKVTMRMPTFADKSYIQTTYPDKLTDEVIKSYIMNNETDYLFITEKLTGGKYEEDSFSLASTNYTSFISLGDNYEGIIKHISDIDAYDAATVTKAEAKTKYHILGLGYDYEDYKVFAGDTYVLFDGKRVTEVYNFTDDIKYTVIVELK